MSSFDEPLRVFGGADAGRRRVAGVERHVHDASPLHPVGRAVGTLGIDVALTVAVVGRIGVDQTPDGPVLGSHLGLDAAPGAPVLRDHDRALDGDPEALEALVVRRHPVVHEDDRPGYVPVDRVRVVGGELLVLEGRRAVAGHHRLPQRGHEFGGRHQLEHPLLRGREEGLELLDLGLESPGGEEPDQPFGIVAPVGRTEGLRPGGEPLHVGPHAVGDGNRLELRFPFALDPARSRREAADRIVGRLDGRQQQQAEGDGQGCGPAGTKHRWILE